MRIETNELKILSSLFENKRFFKNGLKSRFSNRLSQSFLYQHAHRHTLH